MFIVSTDRPEGQKMRLTEEEEQRWSAGKCFFKVLSFPRFLCSSSSRRPSWAWRCCTACRTTAGRGSPPGCTAWACVPYSSSPLCSISSPGRRATWGEEKLNDGGGTLWMLCSHTETTCILLSYCFERWCHFLWVLSLSEVFLGCVDYSITEHVCFRSVEHCFHMCDRVVIYFFIAASYTPWWVSDSEDSHVSSSGVEDVTPSN